MKQLSSRLVSVGDTTFSVSELGTGTPLLLLHGGGPGCTAWTDFGPVAEMFASQYRVVLVDLLQYGKSDMSEIHGPMWDHHSKKMVELLDELGIDRADFVCNSWGGTIALHLAATYPERARALVITGSMPVFEGEPSPALPETGRDVRIRSFRTARELYYGGEGPTKEKMRELIGTLEWYDASRLPEETVELRWRNSLNPEEIALARSANPRGEWQDLTAELPMIQAPVLFLWGMQDAFLKPEYALMLARLVPNGNLYVMDHASHHPQEERPEDYVAVVQGFLSRQH
ncbi:alpha/beta hydrolase [Arthrobacter sp. efr-133-TYG-104]|uniref:alpha/beta fold hydrolase n=1 Tax=Arthrobacter sp. efr-133-TYG-104 TaxID=3040324 RepID=UPI00254E0EC0|nr:alpha/beta hydrolase [Arthrobacter sp. efr-133-TYG-104]